MKRKMGLLISFVAAMLVAGCSGSVANTNTAEKQVGRYQFIGKEKYEDGTVEYACLDTATGSISYATIYPMADKARASLTNFDCSN